MALRSTPSSPFIVVLVVTLLVESGVAHQSGRLEAALDAMSARSWTTRAQGLTDLSTLIESDSSLKSRRDVQRAIIKLLDDEHSRISRAAFEGDAEEGIDFYHEKLMPLVYVLLPEMKDELLPDLVAEMFDGFFNPGSGTSRTIASIGEGATEATLAAADSRDIYTRSKAYDIIGLTLANHRMKALRRPLSGRSERVMRAALLKGLRDRDIVCRRDAVRSVITARERDAIPVLRKLAANDPDDGQSGYQEYSVRGLAARAITELEKN